MVSTPDDVSKIDPTKPSQPIQTGEGNTPQPGAFSSYMQQSNAPNQAGSQVGGPGSVYDVQNNPNVQPGAPTLSTIQSQMAATSGSLGDVQNQLNTKNLKLSPPQKYLLRNKLSDANDNIRSAAAKAGVDVGTPPSAFSRQNPIGKFLSLVNDGQNQMAEAQQRLAQMSKDGGSLQPGEMLMIQIKLSQAQQNLEYSSVLLGKAIEDIKTLFNIQM